MTNTIQEKDVPDQEQINYGLSLARQMSLDELEEFIVEVERIRREKKRA